MTTYEGHSESKEHLRIQPVQLFRCSWSFVRCVQHGVDELPDAVGAADLIHVVSVTSCEKEHADCKSR